MIKKYFTHTLSRGGHGSFYSFLQGSVGDGSGRTEKTSPRGSRLVFLQFPGMDAELELCSFPSSGKVSVPEDLVHLAFQVDDIEACMRKLEGQGIPVTEGPITSENGTRFIFTEDPDKYEIELMQYPEGG